MLASVINHPTIMNTSLANYRQAIGRSNRGRLVHAKRARKLRRRGEAVRFAGYTSTGLAMYRWMKEPRLGHPARIEGRGA